MQNVRHRWYLTCLLCGETGESLSDSASRGRLVVLQEHLMDDHGIPREDLSQQQRFPPPPAENASSYEWALPDGRRWLRAEKREEDK